MVGSADTSAEADVVVDVEPEVTAGVAWGPLLLFMEDPAPELDPDEAVVVVAECGTSLLVELFEVVVVEVLLLLAVEAEATVVIGALPWWLLWWWCCDEWCWWWWWWWEWWP